MRVHEDWLAAVLIELADTGTEEFDEAEYARRFTERLAQPLSPDEIILLIPAGEGGAGRLAVTAGSSPRAAALANLETHGTPGPCGECWRTGSPVRAEFGAEPAAAARWPRYAEAAAAAGFAAISALPMYHREQTIGAVGVLSAGGRSPDARQARLARLLTEAATIGILQQRTLQDSLRTSRQLQQALDSRVVIEQAKGAVSAWLGVSTGEAFELLRAYSRNNGRRLADVADDVIRGELPAPDLRTRRWLTPG